MKQFFYLVFILYIAFTPEILQAQAGNYQRNLSNELPPDEENLSLFF